MLDLPVAAPHRGKFRRDWGLSNLLGLAPARPFGGGLMGHNSQMNAMKAGMHRKVATFKSTAVWPQQLTVQRDYSNIPNGCRVCKVLVDREIDRLAGGGVRVVVQENTRDLTRFIMSPLFTSKDDALGWAQKQMGAEV